MNAESILARPGRLALGLFLLTQLFVVGCQKAQKKSANSVEGSGRSRSASTEETNKPEVQVFVNEAILRKPHAVLGGTIKNVSTESLHDLSVEIELRGRSAGKTERRTVKVEPDDLPPGEQGRYSLRVLSDEWDGSSLVRIRSSSRQQDLAFRAEPGAKRQPERIPEKVVRIAEEPKPRPKPKGEEFLNTPDTAEPIP